MRANNYNLIERLEKQGTNSTFLWTVWAVYTILVIALCSIHEPWGDETNVWSMVYRMSISELFSAMRYEGHFCLWHLCVWPWVNVFNMDYHAIFVASTILMSTAVWLMLFKLDFSFLGKLLIIFSSPFFYQFSVIARCYALIPLFIITLAIIYQKKKNPYLYCFFIGLLAHTHAYMEGMVGILWCLFVYQYVYLPYKNNDKLRAKRNAIASCITVIMVFLAFIQIAGGIIDAKNGTSVASKTINHPTDWLLYVYSNHHIQFTTTLNHYVRFIPRIDLPITIACYCAIIILSYEIIKEYQERIAAISILIVSIVWQIVFAINIYSMWFQRVYLLYLPLLYVIWITYNSKHRKNVIWIMLCFWLLNTSSQYIVIKDISNEYSYDVSASKNLNSHIELDSPIFSCGSKSSWILKRKIHFIDNHPISNRNLQCLEHEFPGLSNLYLIMDDSFDINTDTLWNKKCLCTVEEGENTFTGSGYQKTIYLYRISKK